MVEGQLRRKGQESAVVMRREDRTENEGLGAGLMKTPASATFPESVPCLQGQKGVLCGSDLLSVFPTAGLTSVSNGGTCCRGSILQTN